MGAFAQEVEEYLQGHVYGDDDDAALPNLLNPPNTSTQQPPPSTQTMSRSVDDEDEREFDAALAEDHGDSDEEADDTFDLLSHIADVAGNDTDMQAASVDMRRSQQEEHDEHDNTSTYVRGSGSTFMKLKGRGNRVYPIETADEVALAEELVGVWGEKPKEIALNMCYAVHDKEKNRDGNLRMKSAQVVAKWLGEREARRKRDAAIGEHNMEELAAARSLRRRLDNFQPPEPLSATQRPAVHQAAVGEGVQLQPMQMGGRRGDVPMFPEEQPAAATPTRVRRVTSTPNLSDTSQQTSPLSIPLVINIPPGHTNPVALSQAFGDALNNALRQQQQQSHGQPHHQPPQPPPQPPQQSQQTRGSNEEGRRCQRGGCNQLLSNKDVHARVKGKPYCSKSMGNFGEWLRNNFPNEPEIFITNQLNKRGSRFPL